jgi:hypothetical protein
MMCDFYAKRDSQIIEYQQLMPDPFHSDLILYLTEDGRTRLQVRLEGETVWLSLNQMVDLFQRDKSVISRHIKNVFEEEELVRDSVVAESATTAADGKIYQVEFYNLDVIISVGYRVKSRRGTQFRIWATQRLREYIVKGFAMDDERLKNPSSKIHPTRHQLLVTRHSSSAAIHQPKIQNPKSNIKTPHDLLETNSPHGLRNFE